MDPIDIRDEKVLVSYPYKMKLGLIFLGLIFFGSAAYGLSTEALHNDRGLILEHFIYLSPFEATIFYWVIASLCFGMFLFVALTTIASFLGMGKIVLTENRIHLPSFFLFVSKRTFLYEDIRHMEIRETSTSGSKIRHITIRYFNRSKNKEKKVHISDKMLSQKHFSELFLMLAGRREFIDKK